MPTATEIELRRLEAELENATAQDRAGVALLEAQATKDLADDALARARRNLNDAENQLRFHESCVKRAPDLLAEARFSPQRMLLLSDGEIGEAQRVLLIGLSVTIADLRGFIETADLRAERLRKVVATAKKPIAAAEAAAKAAAATAKRCEEEYETVIQKSNDDLQKAYLRSLAELGTSPRA